MKQRLALVALAALLRVAAAIALGDGFHFEDETDYVDAADRLRAGTGFGAAYARAPGLPLILAPLRAIAPTSLRTVRVLHALLAAGGTALVVSIGTRLLGRGAALTAGLLYAIDPLMVVAAGLLYPEALAAVVLLGALWFALAAVRNDRTILAIAAGVGLGVLALLRPVGLVLVPALAAWMACTVHTSAGRRVSQAAALVVGCLLALAPWTYRNHQVHGGFVPIATAGINVAPVEQERVQAQGLSVALVWDAWERPLPFLRHFSYELGHFFELYPQRLATDNPVIRAEIHGHDVRQPLTPIAPHDFRNVVSILTFGPELLLAMIGIGIGVRDRGRSVLLLAGGTLCYGFGYALFMGKLRYRIPVLPLIFLLAAHGLVQLVDRRPRPHPA